MSSQKKIASVEILQITWLSTETDTKIHLKKIDSEYYDLVETTYNTTVGKIKNALVGSEGKFISGTIMFQ